MGEVFVLAVGAHLLTAELLCLQSVEAFNCKQKASTVKRALIAKAKKLPKTLVSKAKNYILLLVYGQCCTTEISKQGYISLSLKASHLQISYCLGWSQPECIKCREFFCHCDLTQMEKSQLLLAPKAPFLPQKAFRLRDGRSLAMAILFAIFQGRKRPHCGHFW